MIALTGQFAALDDVLTGRENLVLFGRLRSLSKRGATRRADELLERFSLADAQTPPGAPTGMEWRHGTAGPDRTR